MKEDAIRRGLPNRIAVIVQGPKIWCYINGKLIGSAVASEPIAGELGLYLSPFGAKMEFSELRVTKLGPP
jgi:hypothetical protein